MKYYGKISDPHDLVTKQYADDHGGSIDSITINGGSALPIVNKNVNIPLTKTDVGLTNVDNTSDINKPISTATQTALNEKQNSLPTVTNDYYLHANATTGALEWSTASSGIVFNTAYDATNNKAATMSDITNAITNVMEASY